MSGSTAMQDESDDLLQEGKRESLLVDELARLHFRNFSIVCQTCAHRLLWCGAESMQITCHYCGMRMVLLIERDGSHKVLPESNESIADMIAHWLDCDRRDLGYDDDPLDTQQTTSRKPPVPQPFSEE